MRRRTFLSAAAATAAVATTPAHAASTHTVRIENMRFNPATLSVRAGDRIAWQNADVVPHTATCPGRFDSGAIAPGQSWVQPAPAAGRYDVVCTFHPGMKAALVVQ